MKGKSRAWIILPAAIVVIAVIGFVMSSFQKELGLMEPGKGQRAAVAAVATARDASVGVGTDDYTAFGQALLVATVARKNAAAGNAADTRVENLLGEALDCLAALREVWQAEIDHTWDPETQGSPSYWNVLHPALHLSGEAPLTAGDVRRMGAARATELLEKAAELVG